jgi:ComF family protein
MTLSAEAEAILFSPREKCARFARLRHFALDLLFPPHCAACHRPLDPPLNTVLCRGCAERVDWIGTDRCRRCGDRTGAGSGATGDCPSCRTYPPAYVEATCAVGQFKEGPLRDLILSLKFGRRHHIARPLGQLLAARIRATGIHAAKSCVLVPVPLAKEHLRRSGWNHAEEIARFAARELNCALEADLLRKVRATAPQATLKRMARRTNLSDAFACDGTQARRLSETTVILTDDVITTGSTVSECARTLSRAGIKTVRAAAIARA